MWYGDREAPFQGGSGGNKREAKLQGNERIIAVSGYCDDTWVLSSPPPRVMEKITSFCNNCHSVRWVLGTKFPTKFVLKFKDK